MTEFQAVPAPASSPSPISKLYDDLLWAIFRQNANNTQREVEDKTPALRTLVYTSLVCSKWRNLTLSLPSLWADVINLDILSNEEWRKEFVKRAGDIPLSVVCHKEVDGDRNTELTVSFLEEHWERIRYLDIRMGYINWRNFEERIWGVLARPAKELEVFRFFPPLDRFNMDRKPLYVIRPTDFTLFSNEAPVLHTFHAPGIKPNLTAPWFAGVRDLSLTGPLQVNELLSALSHMHCLEVLQDNCDAIIAATEGTVLPHATCPSLKSIIISTCRSIRPYRELITHLLPASTCALSFSVVADENFAFDALALSDVSRILQMLPNYCDLSSATSLSVTLHSRTFDFQAVLPHNVPCVFFLALASASDVSDNYMQVLLSTLASLPLHNANKLSLSIGESADISYVDPEVAEFLSSFSFARQLELSSDTIQFILTLPQEVQDIAFPSVDKVYLTTCSNELDVICIQVFLSARIAVGRPVAELDVRISEFSMGIDLSCLEEFYGLKVSLLFDGFKRDYVCGSGLVGDLVV